jgi:hypothetical protein
MSEIPVSMKCLVLCVARVAACDRQMAAIWPSNPLIGLPSASRPATTVQRQMVRDGLAYARAMTSTANSAETMPPADRYAIRCYTLDNTSA